MRFNIRTHVIYFQIRLSYTRKQPHNHFTTRWKIQKQKLLWEIDDKRVKIQKKKTQEKMNNSENEYIINGWKLHFPL